VKPQRGAGQPERPRTARTSSRGLVLHGEVLRRREFHSTQDKQRNHLISLPITLTRLFDCAIVLEFLEWASVISPEGGEVTEAGFRSVCEDFPLHRCSAGSSPWKTTVTLRSGRSTFKRTASRAAHRLRRTSTSARPTSIAHCIVGLTCAVRSAARNRTEMLPTSWRASTAVTSITHSKSDGTSQSTPLQPASRTSKVRDASFLGAR